MEFKIDCLGVYLKQVRINNNLTLRQVADTTQLSASYISRIENSSSVPSLNSLKKLCVLYSIDLNQIVEMNTDENEGIDINDVIVNEDIRYRGEKIALSDKLSILKFIEAIVNIKDEELKKNYIQTLESLNILVFSKKNSMEESIKNES